MAGKVYSDKEVCLKCVDEYEVLYDDKGDYLLRRASATVFFPDNPEAFRNLTKCQDVLLMTMKQRILLNEPVVRFNHKNDVADLEDKISKIGIPKDVYESIRDVSQTGYKLLKDANVFEVLVEFDAERLANISVFGKTLKMAGFFDMLAMVDESEVTARVKTKHRSRQKLKSSKKTSSKNNQLTKSDSNFEDVESDELDDIKTVSETTVSSKNLGRAALTVVLTARNQVPAKDIYRQLLFSHVHTLSKFFLLVYHVGPLVKKQEVVLYEYKIPKVLQRLLKPSKVAAEKTEKPTEELSRTLEDFQVCLTVKQTTSLGPVNATVKPDNTGYLDVNNLETEFRKFYGRQLQQLSPFKDYFRYVVYDCPGIKDHQRDKKARLERYIAKTERKKEEKRRQKEIKEEEKLCDTARTDMVSSKNGEVGSTIMNRLCDLSTHSETIRQ